MNARKQNKIDWALNVLGLTMPINEASVIDRMNDIRQSWENQNTPDAWKALRDAQEAGNVLLERIEADEMEKASHETVDPLLYFVSPEAAEAARVKEKKRRTKYVIAGAAALLLILAFGIPSAIQNRRERMIQEVFLLRSTMHWGNYEEMEKLLTRLEDEPLVDAIQAEFELIQADLEIWTKHDPMEDVVTRRQAYYRLLAFDEARPAWYLMGLLDLGEDLMPLILNSRFEAGDLFFELKDEASGDFELSLYYNLPESYDQSKSYTLFESSSGKDYRLVNDDDETDVVNLFRIQLVTQTQLTIYCYANQQTYVLNRVTP